MRGAGIARLVDAVRSTVCSAETFREADDRAVVPEEQAVGGAAADGRTDSVTDSLARVNEE